MLGHTGREPEISSKLCSLVGILERGKDFEEEEAAESGGSVSVVEKEGEVAAVVVGEAVDAENEMANIFRGCEMMS